MMVGPHFSAGRAMLAPVHNDNQVPSPRIDMQRLSNDTNAAGHFLPEFNLA